MRPNVLVVTLGVVLSLLVGVGPARAVTIDFTKASDWLGADGKSTFTSGTSFDGVQVTVSSVLVGKLTFNGDEVDSLCGVVTGLACMGDGLGIADDEVTPGAELMTVSFSAPVTVTGIAFLDLFGFPNKSGDSAAETARWSVSPSNQISSVTGTDKTTTLGYQAVVTNYTNVTALHFYASTPLNSDFSVASINIRRVSEPATLLLSGLGVLLALRARSKNV